MHELVNIINLRFHEVLSTHLSMRSWIFIYLFDNLIIWCAYMAMDNYISTFQYYIECIKREGFGIRNIFEALFLVALFPALLLNSILRYIEDRHNRKVSG